MAGYLDTLANLTAVMNDTVSATHTLNNNNSTLPENYTAAVASLSSAANLATSIATSIMGLNVANGALSVLNMDLQSRMLNDAIASGDSERIIKASLDFGAAVAGVLGAVPSPIAPEAKAISLLLTAASQVYQNRVAVGNFLDELIYPKPATPNIPALIPIGDANGNGIPDILESGINSKAKSAADAAKAVLPPRRDPLTFDLHGDGLETTAIAATNPILFDHDGDGVKNGTGWVKPDDGFLVRDVNGNGSIDNGRELFGDSTILTSGARAGQNALDGFDALSDLDSIANGGNADGKISNLDTQFSNLRIWRDLNQDGISQMGDSVTGLGRELFTLTELGIASINIAKTSNSQTLSNGNQIADIGSFTRTDGTQAAVGEVTGNLADINLASDTFHRSFTNVLDTTNVATLPDMQGSGKVRDLREAATQSTTLQNLLTQYAATTTATGQLAQIDQLLKAWADTGGMAETTSQRLAANDNEWRVVA